MTASSRKTIVSLPDNSRFYILLTSALLSLACISWLRLTVPNDQLYIIRLEQIFGLLSVIYLYIAVLISPLSKVVGVKPLMANVIFARRAIGVSAAYFASLHTAVAVWGQIGGLSGLGLLPDRFKLSLLFGAIALAVLLAMAATSFDKVISFMTVQRWKWLHRLVYAGGILIILHVWMIGTHAIYSWAQVPTFIALALFFGLESWRIATNLGKRFHILASRSGRYIATTVMWIVWVALLLALPNLVKSHHSQHDITQTEQHQQGQHEGVGHE